MSAESQSSVPASFQNPNPLVSTGASPPEENSGAEGTVVEEPRDKSAPARLIPSLTLADDAIVVHAVPVPPSNRDQEGDPSAKEKRQPDAKEDLIAQPEQDAPNRRVTRSRAQSSQTSNTSKTNLPTPKRKQPAKSKQSRRPSNDHNASEHNGVTQGSPGHVATCHDAPNSLMPALPIQGDSSSGSLTFALPLAPAVSNSTVEPSTTATDDNAPSPRTEDVPSRVLHQTSSEALGEGGSVRRVRLLVASPGLQHHPTLGPPPGPPGPEAIRRTNSLIESIEPVIRQIERDHVDSNEQEPIEVPDVLEDSSDCDDYLQVLAANVEPLIDDEAEDDCDEDDDESEHSEPNDYDRTDPFINDEPSSDHNAEDDDDDTPRKRYISRLLRLMQFTDVDLLRSSNNRPTRPRKRSRRVPSSSRSPSPSHDSAEEDEACSRQRSAAKSNKRHRERRRRDRSRRSSRSHRRSRRHTKRRRSPSSCSSSYYDSDSASSASDEYIPRRSKRSRVDGSDEVVASRRQTGPSQSQKDATPAIANSPATPSNSLATPETISVNDQKRREAIRQGKTKARDPHEDDSASPDTIVANTNDEDDPRTRDLIRRAIEESRRLWEESLYKAQLEAFSATLMSSHHAPLSVPGPSNRQLPVPSTPFSYMAAASLPTPLLTPSPVHTSNVPSIAMSKPVPPVTLPGTPSTPTASNAPNDGPNVTLKKRKGPVPRPKPLVSAAPKTKPPSRALQNPGPSTGSATSKPSPSAQSSSSTQTPDPASSSTSSNPRRTFKDAMRGRPASSKARDLWDLPGNLPKCRPPNVCGVKPTMDRDAVLEEGYGGLENSLQPAVFTKWTKSKGPGYFVFAHWGEQCPDLYEGLLLRAVTFVRHKAMVNFCRAPTTLFTAKKQGTKKGRYHVYIGNRPAVGLLLGYLDKSQLCEPDGKELRQKFVNIIPMLGEFDMYQAAICNILHSSTLSAQLGMNALQIATRTNFALGDTRTGKSHLFSRGAREKEDDNEGDTNVRTNGFSLDNTADVPVYDLREHPDFNFSSDLDNVHKLPRWEEEIPVGSCVVVAHTVGTYLSPSTGKKHVTFNIQFVLLLALPAPVEEALSEVEDGQDDGEVADDDGDCEAVNDTD
ncbi:hypothetical protein CC2G_006836 [Coprinopsis cinerea AmutBmut pab1-1]|nr:hypothetical protein CC2G_006836 [Coprinopsis cinerea AmutBmut pab1-1]